MTASTRPGVVLRAAAFASALAVCAGCGVARTASEPAAAGAAAPMRAVVRDTPAKAPVVRPGIRPGSRELACPKDGMQIAGVLDYTARAYEQPGELTSAQTLRRHLKGRHDRWSALAYERRAPAHYAGDTASDRRNTALFVGLRPNGTVKARYDLHRDGAAKKWLVTGFSGCAGRSRR